MTTDRMGVVGNSGDDSIPWQETPGSGGGKGVDARPSQSRRTRPPERDDLMELETAELAITPTCPVESPSLLVNGKRYGNDPTTIPSPRQGFVTVRQNCAAEQDEENESGEAYEEEEKEGDSGDCGGGGALGKRVVVGRTVPDMFPCNTFYQNESNLEFPNVCFCCGAEGSTYNGRGRIGSILPP